MRRQDARPLLRSGGRAAGELVGGGCRARGDPFAEARSPERAARPRFYSGRRQALARDGAVRRARPAEDPRPARRSAI